MKNKLETLDGARGVAAIAVLLYHLGQWTENRWIMSHGYLAVDFFFCMSGFIMAYAYGSRLESGMTFLQFAKMRTIRLYPIVALGTVLGAIYYVALTKFGHQSYSVTDVLLALRGIFLIPFLFVASPIGPGIYPLNALFWSIFYELIANFAWAAFLRKLPAFPMFVCAAVIAVFAYSNDHPMSWGGEYNQLHWGMLRVLLSFTAGLAVYRFWETKRRIIPVSPWWILLILAIAMAAPQSLSYFYDLFCVIILFPVLTATAVCVRQGAVERPVMKWLGDVSYPLYGIHRPICSAIILVMAKLVHAPAVNSTLTIFLSVAVSLVSATVVFHFFDAPVRAYLSGRKRPAVEHAAP